LFALPAWSADAKNLAVADLSMTEVFGAHLAVVPAGGGPEALVPSQPFMRVSGPTWLPDGGGLIVPAMGTHKQLWVVSYPEGTAQRITHDLLRYFDDVRITADSRSLVTVQEDFISSVWVAPLATPDRIQRVTSPGGHYVGVMGIAWTSD